MKIKKIIWDMFFNMFSFGIYIVSQQLIMMPAMSRILPSDDFANLVVYVSIFAIISNVLGSELGITRQVNEDYDKGEDYNRILLILLPIITGLSIFSLSLLKYDTLTVIFLTIAILLANIRLYSASYFRLKKNFTKVLVQNIIYLVGVIIGLVIFNYYTYIWLPILVPEVLILIFNLINTDILKNGIKKTENQAKIWKTFIGLGFISLLVNGITYFDKILIYPILGEVAVSIYYATNSMSKIISLITNPLHGVILSWLKSDNKELKDKVIKMLMKVNIPMVIITFCVSVPLTYFALKILYPQYMSEAIYLIIPICIALAFATAATLVKSILLKYVKSKELVKVYLLYFITFTVLSIVMSNNFGIQGFAYSNVISKFILWISFLIVLKKVK